MTKGALPTIKLFKLIGGLIALYGISRLLFWGANYNYFSNLSSIETLTIFFFGIRFDLSTIIFTNCLFILLYIIPFRPKEANFYNQLLKLLFVTVNSIATAINLIDVIYFQFTLKRTTGDILIFLNGSIGNDFFKLMPIFIIEYWYMSVIWVIITFLLYLFYSKVEKQESDTQKTNLLFQAINFILIVGASIILYRGGLQMKPINALVANQYAKPQNTALVLNTTFTFFKSLDSKGLESLKYFNERSLTKIYSTKKQSFGNNKQLNVVLIILESFSKEHIGYLNKKGYSCTPFLDSLMAKSLTCTNAFANGKTSITGIPSVTAGMPSWMQEPYITSRYGTNKINSIANTLKKHTSAFFHGGANGTMGFDQYAKVTGYDHYFGLDEYNNNEDYDNSWGIWDEEFLQFTANCIDTLAQPFFSTIFTLSSHHPYNIPKKHKERFNNFNSRFKNTIEYTDYALQRFFKTAQTMPWFENTLFVISADHTGVSKDEYFSNDIGKVSIPIVYFHHNSNLKGKYKKVSQQIDIYPSIIDYIGCDNDTYFAFGNSIFDSTAQRFSMSYNQKNYSYIDDKYLLQFDGNKTIGLYNYTKDSILKNNMLNQAIEAQQTLETKTKAIIQTYNNALLKDKHYL